MVKECSLSLSFSSISSL